MTAKNTATKPAADLDLKSFNVKQLNELIANASSHLEQTREEARNDLRQRVEKLCAAEGFEAAELFRKPRKASPVKYHYKNPDDPEQVWRGRGKKPDWLTAAMKKGTDITKFRVAVN